VVHLDLVCIFPLAFCCFSGFWISAQKLRGGVHDPPGDTWCVVTIYGYFPKLPSSILRQLGGTWCFVVFNVLLVLWHYCFSKWFRHSSLSVLKYMMLEWYCHQCSKGFWPRFFSIFCTSFKTEAYWGETKRGSFWLRVLTEAKNIPFLPQFCKIEAILYPFLPRLRTNRRHIHKNFNQIKISKARLALIVVELKSYT